MTARRILVYLVAPAALAALAVSVVASLGSDDEHPPLADTAGVVVLDGWSHATLDGRGLVALAGNERYQLEFTPAGDEDLAELLVRSPRTVRDVLARQVTADVSLSCTSTGCTTSTGPVDLASLTTDLPAVVRAQGVDHGVFLARLPVAPERVLPADAGEPATTTTTTTAAPPRLAQPAVPAPGPPDADPVPPTPPGVPSQGPSSPLPGTFTPPVPPDEGTDPGPVTTLPPAPADPVDPALLEPGPAQTPVPVPPAASTPPPSSLPPAPEPGEGVLAVVAAFGIVGTLEVPWLPDDTGSVQAPFGNPRLARPVDAAATPLSSTPRPAMTTGLRTADPAATGLTPAQLTAWSSPTTGCGPAVLCAMDDAGTTYEQTMASSHRACLLSQAAAVEDPAPVIDSASGVDVVVREFTLTLSGDDRVQFGSWPPGLDTGVLPWPVPVPEVADPTVMSFRVIEVVDAEGLLVTAGEQVTAGDGAPGPWDLDAALGRYGSGVLFACPGP